MSRQDILEVFKKRTRHPQRPRSGDVIRAIFPHFRQHAPYQGSLVLGEADRWDRQVFVIGQQKPKPEDFRTKGDLEKLNYGMLTSLKSIPVHPPLSAPEASRTGRKTIAPFISFHHGHLWRRYFNGIRQRTSRRSSSPT